MTRSHERRLLAAAFTAILATGVGFAVRGGILANWGQEFGFTAAELGVISGAGFTGFTFGIIVAGVICDRVGYGMLIASAFSLHLLSALITFLPAPGAAQQTAHVYLYWGTFVFALANGTLEAAVNPLIATLYPENRSHYLNILHAGWPLGMIIGGAAGWLLGDEFHVHWKVQLGLFLLPTIAYGLLFLRQSLPRSSVDGLTFGEMIRDVGLFGGTLVCLLLALFVHELLAPGVMSAGLSAAVAFALLIGIGIATHFSFGSLLLGVLFIAHALVGTVELGTDGWIQNITGNLLTPSEGKLLFVLTALVMFLLRFSMCSIERRLKLTPLGVLLACSILACVGLNLASAITSFTTALLALGIYAIGKSFFWPTMLAITADRFPRSGAVAISIMGGVGYLAAGLIGTPGLGYAKDRFAADELRDMHPASFEVYKASEPSRFLWFEPSSGLDGRKLAALKEKLRDAREEAVSPSDRSDIASQARSTSTERAVLEADVSADRHTLKADAMIPIGMALIYLVLLVYFQTQGGYRVALPNTAKREF